MRKFLFTVVLIAAIGAYGHVTAQAPVISSNPTNAIVCAGHMRDLLIEYGGVATTILWEVSADGGASWNPITDNATYSGSATKMLAILANSSLNHNMYRCTVSNADGSSAPSAPATLLVSSTPPNQPVFVNPSTSLCQAAPVVFAVSGGLADDSIIWNPSACCGIDPNSLFGLNDSIIIAKFANPTTLTLYAAALNGCGYVPGNPITITINPLQSAPAGSAGSGSDCASYVVYPGPTPSAYSDGTCSPISAITPTGANPVSGMITSCVTVDASVQSFNGTPYVQRHYSLEPATNASTSTATVTLYFTQADFDAYNLARGSNPALPANPTDAAGIGNLRITQFHGTGTTPGTYAGGSGEIDPDDNDIVWNATASRWEVTFNITGFSGFFVSGGSLVPLPLTLVDFTGQSTKDGNLLHWVTASEENTAYFQVERKTENGAGSTGAGTGNTGGGGFQPLTKIPAAGNSNHTIDYSYTDGSANGLNATLSYRLHMVDIDGKSTYSKIVTLQPAVSSLFIRILPNPSHQPLSLTVGCPQAGPATLTVTDMSGTAIVKQALSLQKGENNLDPQVIAGLPKGLYLISVISDSQKQTVKFIKE